jgi:beta-glucosidase-like glycosyl hydrolase
MTRLRKILSLIILAMFIVQISGCDKSKEKVENYGSLNAQEVKLIDNYISDISVEEGVGQLFMVGIPADLSTADDSDNKALDELIAARGVGMVIVNGFNYWGDIKASDDIEYLSRVIHFNNLLQFKTAKSKSKLPLLVAIDFEGPISPSIRRGVVLPPSALSLSTSQNGQLIRSVGRYIGTELSNLGIQVILGPVLDTYNIRQGTKNILQDRCFAATPEGVARTASHYIAGLTESGIVVFAKHYPSYGSIETDPHKEIIPVYEGSRVQMSEEIKPFIQSVENIHGIMTSHILLANSKEGGMATFSQELIDDINKHGLDKKIIITDDLSDMGAINKYMLENHKTYKDVAVDAFDAGHNMLLFAHIADEKKSKNKFNRTYVSPRFTLKDLRQVQERLVEHIESSDFARKHYYESLRKILILKAEVAKLKSPSEPVSRLFSNKQGSDSAFNFQVKNDTRTVIDNIDKSMGAYQKGFNIVSLKEEPGDGEIGNKLVKESIRESVIWINNKDVNINLHTIDNSKKIIFAVYEDHLGKFREAFSPRFKKALFFGIPIKKDTSSFENLERNIEANFSNADLLVYTARDGSDTDLLKRLRNRFGKNYSKKVIIFCHNSPAIFDNSLISDSNFIGNFSMHPLSFDVDVEILNGDVQPKALENIPINIGDNAKFYNVSNTKWVEPANPTTFGDQFPQQSDISFKNNLEKKYYLVPKSSSELLKSYWYIVATILIVLLFAIYLSVALYGKRKNSKRNVRNVVSEKPEYPSKVTIAWLFSFIWNHVPIGFWIFLIGILSTVFFLGVHVGGMPTIHEWYK